MKRGIIAITAAVLLAVPALGQARDPSAQHGERHARVDARQADRHVRHERHDAGLRRVGWQRHDRHSRAGRDDQNGWRDAGRGGQGWNGLQRGGSAHAAQDYNRRISAGLRSGALTPREARSLRRELQSVRAARRGYLADGHYSSPERSEIRDAYRDLAARIRAESRDGERRY